MRFGKALGILICLHIGLCVGNTLSESEERTAIVQFFKYKDGVSRFTAENIVDLLVDFFKRLYESVPEKDQGENAALVKNFVDNLEYAKSTGDTREMEKAAADFDNIEEKLLANLMSPDREDISLRQDSVQMIALLQRLAEVSEKFLKKLNRASEALIAKFTDEGFGRHERLFAVLTQFKNIHITDSQRPDELLAQLQEIRKEYVD